MTADEEKVLRSQLAEVERANAELNRAVLIDRARAVAAERQKEALRIETDTLRALRHQEVDNFADEIRKLQEELKTLRLQLNEASPDVVADT